MKALLVILTCGIIYVNANPVPVAYGLQSSDVNCKIINDQIYVNGIPKGRMTPSQQQELRRYNQKMLEWSKQLHNQVHTHIQSSMDSNSHRATITASSSKQDGSKSVYQQSHSSSSYSKQQGPAGSIDYNPDDQFQEMAQPRTSYYTPEIHELNFPEPPSFCRL